ncbi:MAG TPA: hypothetical protein VIT65_11235 [Microlunatus sp.]
MGQTSGYALPWPELVDGADGPDGYQKLAQASETAIKTNALRLLGQGVAADISSTEVRATPWEAPFTVALPSTARVVICTVNVCIAFAGATSGLFDVYSEWDGVRQFHAVLNSYTNQSSWDRGYTWQYALKNQPGGNHAASIGMFSGTGAVIHTKTLIHSWVALG